MDLLDDELLKFWRTLKENSVRYIIVGGFATRFHGFNRSTNDIDLLLEDTLENKKVYTGRSLNSLMAMYRR